jgi:hypothetical protein
MRSCLRLELHDALPKVTRRRETSASCVAEQENGRPHDGNTGPLQGYVFLLLILADGEQLSRPCWAKDAIGWWGS